MEEVYALGSYSRSLGVYLLDQRSQLLCLLEGQKGGITHIKFTPDGTKLVAGGRKDHDLLVWDMRQPGELYAVLNRKVTTNQRIYFDIDPKGQYVVSGNTDGSATVWNLDNAPENEDKVIQPSHDLKDLHKDAVNGCSLHPWLPMLATCSGQRHVNPPKIDKDEDEIEEDEVSNIAAFENSLKIWSLK